MRTSLSILCAMLVCAGATFAQRPRPEVRLLWKDGAPGAKGTASRDQPDIRIYLPPKDKANGCSVVVLPGGGYGGLAMGHEGHQIAEFFNSFGVAAFVCKYRVSPYRHPIPGNDAKRAVRTVRHHAKDFGVDPNRIGIMGFSAGGHNASTVATHHDPGDANAKDPIDRHSSRPDFAILCYPVITFTEPHTHKGSRNNLLGDKRDDEEMIELLSNEKQVKADTPPTFLFHTSEDRAVPPENSVLFYMACRKADVPVEMHIYRKGRHGVGLALSDPVLRSWSERLKDWIRAGGWLSSRKRTAVDGEVKLNDKPLARGHVAFVPKASNDPIVIVSVNKGKFKLGATDGPVIGPCTIEVHNFDVGWQNYSNDFEGVIRVDAAATLKDGENQLQLSLKNK